jgi:hypothetical protein
VCHGDLESARREDVVDVLTDVNLIPVTRIELRDVSNADLCPTLERQRDITPTAVPVDAGIVTKVSLG